MDKENKSEIILIPKGNSPKKIENSIAAYSKPLSDLLIHIGLPTENILTPIEEIRKVIYTLESTLEILPIEEKNRAVYLSKFTIAISVGLFDGAINFLWDETIKALRRLITSFDLQYFFTVSQTVNSKYKNLSTEDDLEAITDHDLLEICRRLGLLSDINHRRLENVNYLRNHASAAHPNDNSVSGLEMLGLLENCLKYAILAKPNHSVIQIKKLFHNIRNNDIPQEDCDMIGADLIKQPQERLDDFFLSIFGVYADERTESRTRINIDRLTPSIWDYISEDVKYYVGSKFGLYRKNGEINRKNFVQKFLENVRGLQYKDEDSLAAELLDKLQNLKTVHFEWNNFYNEYAHAKSIDDSIPSTGIPKSIKRLFVKVICICYIGNGKGYREGIDERAELYYKKFINAFTIDEIIDFLYLFQDQEFTTDMFYSNPDKRARRLAKFFKSKTQDRHINTILDLIINFPEKRLQNVTLTSEYRDSIKFIN